MSEPEISRRCPSCGASLRGHALFCPQCGQPLPQSKEIPKPTEDGPASASAIDVNKRDPQVPNAEATARQTARRKIQRATTAARDALEDNVRPRVEKIRNASSFVLEEASDDPSLRFVLVAGALFLLFVVLLVISKVI